MMLRDLGDIKSRLAVLEDRAKITPAGPSMVQPPAAEASPTVETATPAAAELTGATAD